MNSKLTLVLDAEIIEKGKSYAKLNHTSLSKLFENYLRSIDDGSNFSEIGPLTKSIMGSIHLPENVEYKALVQDAKKDKFCLES